MKWLVGALVILLAAILVAADRGGLPGFVKALYAFPGGDKVGHFVLMGALSFLLNLTLMARSRARLSRLVLFGNLALAVAIAVEEASQLFFASRTLSLPDLASSYAGLLVFAYLAYLAVGWRFGRHQNASGDGT